MNQKRNKALIALLLVMTYLFLVVVMVYGDPVGGSISSNTTSTRTANPDLRSDNGGTITTMILGAVQQNYAWKAYVGNITGSLVLDNANNKSIYQWSLTTLTGEVFASRNSTISWTSLSCVSNASLATEQAAVNMGTTDVDSINNTFDSYAHKQFSIAGNTLTANTCRSIATNVNDTTQTPSASAIFQEIMINDSSQRVVYVTGLETDLQGYDNSSTFDFQLIVPDDDTAGQQTTYYFYVELDS